MMASSGITSKQKRFDTTWELESRLMTEFDQHPIRDSNPKSVKTCQAFRKRVTWQSRRTLESRFTFDVGTCLGDGGNSGRQETLA